MTECWPRGDLGMFLCLTSHATLIILSHNYQAVVIDL